MVVVARKKTCSSVMAMHLLWAWLADSFFFKPFKKDIPYITCWCWAEGMHPWDTPCSDRCSRCTFPICHWPFWPWRHWWAWWKSWILWWSWLWGACILHLWLLCIILLPSTFIFQNRFQFRKTFLFPIFLNFVPFSFPLPNRFCTYIKVFPLLESHFIFFFCSSEASIMETTVSMVGAGVLSLNYMLFFLMIFIYPSLYRN